MNKYTAEKSLDRYEAFVASTVKEMLDHDEKISRSVELVFTALKASHITKEKLESVLMRHGFLGAK